MRTVWLLMLAQPAVSLLRAPSPLLRARPAARRLSALRLDESAAATGEDEKKLVTMASLQGESLDLLKYTLTQRNKERILEGKEQYENIEAMIEEYMNFEGKDKDMSYADCEDAVLWYLQRKAIMAEGTDGLTDPQTLITLVLLVGLIIGVVSNALGIHVPLPNNEPPPAS